MFTSRSSGVSAKRGRVQALDAVRAIALLLMIFGHVANYSFLWRTTHFAYFVWDGASIFMVVSGIVVAQVNRIRIATSGFTSAAQRLARRAGFLYVLQFLLVAVATATAYFLPSPTSAQFVIPGAQNWGEALAWGLVLGANPIYVNFLSTYVVVLLAAIPALWLLATRRYAVLALLAVLLYIAGLVWPSAFTLPNGPDGTANFNNATWFVLFLSGLVVGWVWHDRDVGTRLTHGPVLVVSGVVTLVLLALVIWDALPLEPGVAIRFLVDKDWMSPGRFVAAWAFFIILYWALSRLSRWRIGASGVRWLSFLGRYPVDTIVILTLVTIASQGLLGLDSSGHVAQILGIVTAGVSWVWAYWRLRARSVSGRSTTT